VRIDVVPGVILLGLSCKGRRGVNSAVCVYFFRAKFRGNLQVGGLFGFVEAEVGLPRAQPSIITNTHDRAIIFRSYKAKAVHGVLMSVGGKARFLCGVGSSTGIPLQ